MISTNDELLGCREVADLLGMSLSWVYLHSQPGAQPQLPHLRVGHTLRFRRNQIEAFLRDCESAGSIGGDGPAELNRGWRQGSQNVQGGFLGSGQ